MSEDRKSYKKKESNLNFNSFESGKLPPQNTDLEEVILGACLLEANEIFNTVYEIIFPDVFYKENHKKIFEAMINLHRSNSPIDILTVVAELRKMSSLDMVGGPYAIGMLTNRVSSSLNTEYHCRVILQKYMARELIRISSLAIASAYDEETDIIDEIEATEKKIAGISEGFGKDGTQSIFQVAETELKRIRENIGKTKVSGIPYPLKELNEQTGGMQEGEMIIIAGRPGMGKSALSLDILIHAAKSGFPCALFNLEMMNREIMQRFISKKTYIQIRDLKSLNLSERDIYEISTATQSFTDTQIYLSDDPVSTLPTLRRAARKLVREKGVKLIIVDYLQLMSDKTPGRTRENEVSEISRAIKLLAKELKLPIIALSQLSRNVEQRGGDKRPMLSDLRESGALEQEADVIMFVYRPELYGHERIMTDLGEVESTNKAWIDIAKNRNGGLTQTLVNFHKSTTTFSDFESLNDLPESSPSTFKHRSEEF